MSDPGSPPESPLDSPPTSITSLPSVCLPSITSGISYTYHSPIPASIPASIAASISSTTPAPIILGVDEAGRGPVLGPMVYAIAYCLQSDAAILKTHKFDDSKKLKTDFRSSLMQTLTTPSTALHKSLGWSTLSLSPASISQGMLRATSSGIYNLNAQALDATVALITSVIASGVPVSEIYVDTVGPPGPYQARLQKQFPTAAVTVAKKADSLYPIVSAASVCAKVTRDAALEVLGVGEGEMGSGYPGDEKTKAWLRGTMDPVFGWSPAMCRFSWSTAKDLLEGGKGTKAVGACVEWAEDLEEGETGIMGFLGEAGVGGVGGWYGRSAGVQMDF